MRRGGRTDEPSQQGLRELCGQVNADRVLFGLRFCGDCVGEEAGAGAHEEPQSLPVVFWTYNARAAGGVLDGKVA